MKWNEPMFDFAQTLWESLICVLVVSSFIHGRDKNTCPAKLVRVNLGRV